jgi:deoxycytidylate deaminase
MKILEGEEIGEARFFLRVASKASKHSKCLKRPRGVVIVNNGEIIAKGWNAPADSSICKTCLRDRMKPKLFSTFNTEPCYSVHAEQRAIINAFKHGYSDLSRAKMYFARSDRNGVYMPCDDGPSCTICSKLILESGIKSFIYEACDEGIVELPALEFHNLSMDYVEKLSS